MALGWRGSYLRYREFFLNVLVLYRKRADLRAFLEIILSISTITIFLVFALKPTALTIISLIQQIQEKRTTLAALDLKANNLEAASLVYTQNQNVIPDINAAVSTPADPDVVAKQVQGLAAKDLVGLLGLSIGQTYLVGKDISAKKVSDLKPIPQNPQEMPVSISIKGDYPSILTFVKDFENLRVVSKVDVLAINSSQTENGQSIVAIISTRFPFLGK